MSKTRLRVGDRVRVLWGWGTSKGNGTIASFVGPYSAHDENYYFYNVKWDDGSSNRMLAGDLEKISVLEQIAEATNERKIQGR